MSRITKRAVLLVGICFPIAVAVLVSCDGEDNAAFARQALEAERKLSQVQAELARCRGELARAREKLAAAEQRADQLARQLATERLERRGAAEKADAGQAEFYGALALAFSAVVATILVLQLLLKERRARKVLAKLFHWLRRRNNST